MLGYLSQLRVDRVYRGRVGLLPQGYALMRSVRARSDLPFDLTTIVADNHTARRVLGAGLAGIPAYQELEAFTTLMLPLWRHQRTRPTQEFRIERGSSERMEDIATCLERNRARYQFAPCWTASDLLSPERSRGLAPRDFLVAVQREMVIGCIALWDQSSFKQIVVHNYGPTVRRWRPMVEISARLFGTPRLPSPGRPIPHVFLSHVAIDDDNVDVFSALLAEAYNDARKRRHACLVAGFAERHPFLQMIRRSYRAWTYSSIIYAVCWEGGTAAAEGIDQRIPHLEVGVL